jgi:hypothetical protein
MEQLGERITDLGFRIIPYSFITYIPYRWLEYKWQFGYTRLVKSIWYLALGISYLFNRVGIDTLIMYICFMEAWDLFFQQKEKNLNMKQ